MYASFVDRVDDLAELHRMTAGLPRGKGAAVVIEGRSGIGKTALLQRFAAYPGADSRTTYRVVMTSCRPAIGEGLAYGPITDILVGLQRRSRRSGIGRLLWSAGRGAVKSAPDVLSSLVPGLAPLLTMARAATESALRSGTISFDSLQPFQQAIASHVADRIFEFARSGRPAVVIIDDVQFIDPSSLLVLDILLRRIASEPLTLVLGMSTPMAPEEPERAVAQLVARWQQDGLVRRQPVGALSEPFVAELITKLELPTPPGFSARLTEATGGLPVLVSLCLQRWQPQDGAQVVLPETVAEFVAGQLAALSEDDRRLLALAAVQGSMFLSNYLALAAERPHDDVLDRLQRLARPGALLRVVPSESRPNWMTEETADVYAFDHLLLWDAVYHAQTDEQRRSRHERLARIIGEVLQSTDRPPLGLRLEYARHLELGGSPCLSESSAARLALARSAAMEGLSFAEAEMHCAIAIDAILRARQSDENDRRLVDAVEMQLSMTEVRWRGQQTAAGSPANIDELAEKAERAAARVGALDLKARSALQRGKTLLATRGQGPALEKLAEAVEFAREHGDPVLLYVATVEFGRHVSKRNLAEGLAALREAERMYVAHPQLAESDDPVLVHTRNVAEMQLGVTLFDSGYLEEALGRLDRCVGRLRGELLNANLPIAFNYLAQVQLAIGQSARAEETLREALAFEERRGGDSGWHANNAALLALVLSADRRRADECRALIEDAWLETERTWLLNLVPIVRNLYAEVLLALPRSSVGDEEKALVTKAERLARDTCLETETTGMIRSRIPALCLSARAHLRMGRSTQAADFARQAVTLLDQVGDMPALRTEEILFHAASVLWADGDVAEAAELMSRAEQSVERKAERIEDEALRRTFLDDVPLNRWIRSGLPGGAGTLECGE